MRASVAVVRHRRRPTFFHTSSPRHAPHGVRRGPVEGELGGPRAEGLERLQELGIGEQREGEIAAAERLLLLQLVMAVRVLHWLVALRRQWCLVRRRLLRAAEGRGSENGRRRKEERAISLFQARRSWFVFSRLLSHSSKKKKNEGENKKRLSLSTYTAPLRPLCSLSLSLSFFVVRALKDKREASMRRRFN